MKNSWRGSPLIKAGGPPKKTLLFWGLIIGLVVLDQIFKNWAYHRLSGRANFFILKPFLSLEFYQNFGIAFGLPLPAWAFYGIVVFILVILGYFGWQYYQKRDCGGLFALALVAAGAASNLLDRLRFGYVVDYINIAFWPVFNIADVMVVGGVIILFIKAVHKGTVINIKCKM